MTSWAEFSRRHIFAPNGLSVLRGLLGCLIPFLLFDPNPQHHLLAFGIFIFAAITDYLDGLLARLCHLETKIGKLVDPLADKVLVLVAFWAFAKIGLYSVWWIVPVIMRELLITMCRFGWVLEGKVIGAEKLGKLKFCFQIATLLCSFGVFLSDSQAFLESYKPVLTQWMNWLLVLTTALTVISGMSFLYNQRKHFNSPVFAQFVTAAGVGLLKPAPGTWGSAFGVFMVILTAWNIWLFAALFLFFILAGYWAVPRLQNAVKDPSFVVLDEITGIFITFLFIPLTFKTVLIGFVLFRIFDILKPFPLRHLEKLPGFSGILLDDLGAGLYAWLILYSTYVGF